MTEGEFIVEEAVEALSEYDMFQALEARLEEILVSTISASWPLPTLWRWIRRALI